MGEHKGRQMEHGMKFKDILKGAVGYWMVALAGLFGGMNYMNDPMYGLFQAFLAPVLITVLLLLINVFFSDKVEEALERVRE